MKRHNDAVHIWYHGASNPRAVARALVKAIDEACEEGQGSAGAKDAAVQMILDQLCSLCGLPSPFYQISTEDLGAVMDKVAEGADSVPWRG